MNKPPKHKCQTCGHNIKHLCVVCGAPATHFCDAYIGSEVDDKGFTGLDKEQFLCVAPLCGEHAFANGFMCGENFVDTMDYCPIHKDRLHGHIVPMTKEIAEQTRRGFAAEYRSAGFKSVPAHD